MGGDHQGNALLFRDGRRLQHVTVPVRVRMDHVGVSFDERVDESGHDGEGEMRERALDGGEAANGYSVDDGSVVGPSHPAGLVEEVAREDRDLVARGAQTAHGFPHRRLHAARGVEAEGHVRDLHRSSTLPGDRREEGRAFPDFAGPLPTTHAEGASLPLLRARPDAFCDERAWAEKVHVQARPRGSRDLSRCSSV